MARRWISLTLVIAMSGCGNPQRPANENRVAETSVSTTEAPSVPADPAQIGPGEPGGLPDDRTPFAEGSIDPKSAQGAGLVLQRYAGLLEQRKFAEARLLWSDDGKASGLTEKEFSDSFTQYSEIHSEIGSPGEMEGAAGSSFVEIPFRLFGKLASGKPFNQVGSVAMRRVNDVPGSSAADRQWHLYRSDLAKS